MHSITSFALSKLNNAEFVGYFVNLKKVLDGDTSGSLGIEPAVVTNFATLQQKLIDQVYTARGSEYTAAMQAADSKRDQVFKRIHLHLQQVTVAEEHSDLLSCKDVVEKVILSKYPLSVMSMPQHEESAVIQGFCYDLRDKLTEDQLDILGITSDIARLEQSNGEFITAYNNRSNERATSDIGLTVKLRTEMLDVYQQICFTVQFLANSTVEANAAKATACQSFISTVNVMLADVKKRWTARTGGEENAASDTPGSEDPADENPADENPGGSDPEANPDPEGVHEVEV